MLFTVTSDLRHLCIIHSSAWPWVAHETMKIEIEIEIKIKIKIVKGMFFKTWSTLIWQSLYCASSEAWKQPLSFPSCYSCLITHTWKKEKIVLLHKWAHRHPWLTSVTGKRVMTPLIFLSLNPSYRWLRPRWDSNLQSSHVRTNTYIAQSGKDVFFASGKDVFLNILVLTLVWLIVFIFPIMCAWGLRRSLVNQSHIDKRWCESSL